MKTVSKLILLTFILSAAVLPAFAESAGQAGAFLKMGVGARALGMGSAFTAVADDSTAAFWNPAGLALLQKSEASFMHANLTLDRSYNFFTYAHVLKDQQGKSQGTVALSHIRFGVDGIPETRESTTPGQPATRADGTYVPGENVYIFSYFDDTETSTFGTYARKLADKFYGGVNVKSLKQSLFTNSADSWGLDLGFMYQPNTKSSLGLSVRDIGESLAWNTSSGQKDRIPVTTTLGTSYKPNDKLTLAVDLNKVQDMDAKFRAGAEYWFKDIAALRLGSQGGDLTLGASFQLQSWRFDYSYVDETLGAAHRISALVRF
ncbi:MAG: PorV/PorQ family protein [Candidatus Riflebacteria bacterium]|nr:PorV/PorQ family protein [Candidatus Riflebacteria bacterium]